MTSDKIDSIWVFEEELSIAPYTVAAVNQVTHDYAEGSQEYIHKEQLLKWLEGERKSKFTPCYKIWNGAIDMMIEKIKENG